jgi:threonine dehydratase
MADSLNEKIIKKIQNAISDEILPLFPVSPIRKISIPGFSNIWIKDESVQETGTHKDRMAWEIILTYLDILKNDKNSMLPKFSIISAGSAALAIQTQFRKYGLPNLKILVDVNTNHLILDYLKSLGCEIYKTELSEKILFPEDILRLTDNFDGFDITSNKSFDPSIRFYDWMSYEILNENPDYIFVPFGTGNLFENIINTCKEIASGQAAKTVYSGDSWKISKINILGGTTNDKNSKAIKLFAPFRPFTSADQGWVRLASKRGLCGIKSAVKEIEEKILEKAFELMVSQGFACEYSATAGLASFLQEKQSIPPDAKVIIVSTGKAKLPFNL